MEATPPIVLLPNSESGISVPAGYRAVIYDVTTRLSDQLDDSLRRRVDVFVCWGTHPCIWNHLADDLPSLRLVQDLAAGADDLRAAHLPDTVIRCSGVGLHDATVSEHTLALLLSLVRRLPQAAQAQSTHHWDESLGGSQPLHPAGPITTLLDARVVILGFGSIATHLTPLLQQLGATVTGVARRSGQRAGVPVASIDDLLDCVRQQDVVISILPGTDQTHNVVDHEVFQAMNSDAFFINVGRGATVDPQALIEALESKEIAGAAIDVTPVEPLRPEDPLWTAPNLIITPHGAGGRPVNAAARLAHNVAALSTNGPFMEQIR